jgi:hypothetical protein
MKYGNGPVIERPKVVLVFRGPGWSNGAPAAADVKQVFSAILASPYASRLVQYGSVRRPTLVDTMTDTSLIGHLGADPRGFLTTQVLLIDTTETIQAVINARKNGGSKPVVDDALYLVIVSGDPQPIFSEPRLNNDGGFHEQFLDADGTTVRYGVVLNWSKNTLANIWNSGMCLPGTLTHEMVEASTDPDARTGYRLDNGDEIGDLNDVRAVQLPGITQTIGVAAYWSDLEGAGVAPTSYSFRVTFGLRASDTLPSVKKVIGGTSVLAAMRAKIEP